MQLNRSSSFENINVFLTWIIVMLTIWRDVEVGRSVVVELTRF